MKVRCISNKAEYLRSYEYENLSDIRQFGRFGVSGYGEYNDLEIGKEYFVMGVIILKSYQAYLLDDNNDIFICPCQLFQIIDNQINYEWYFRPIQKDENIYPFIQAIFGYWELCFDKKAYENLIIEKDDYAKQIYFNRKGIMLG